MLKSFTVQNYRNFKEEITIRFDEVGGYKFNEDCITNSLIGKMIIYGRNSTGKTNLGKALLDIKFLLIQPLFSDFFNDNFLNGDSDDSYAKFTYMFQFGSEEVKYQYTKCTKNVLKDERLEWNKKELYFIDFEHLERDYDYSKLLEHINVDEVMIRNYFDTQLKPKDETSETLPFLRWIFTNTALEENSIFIKLRNFIRNMNEFQGMFIPNFHMRRLLLQEEKLKNFITLLEKMELPTNLQLEENLSGEKELYFSYKNKQIPFYENASSGLRTFLDLYLRILYLGERSSLLYLDEFDAFYHYEMAERIVEYLKQHHRNCQVIITTHNTNLMTNRLMRPDCLFILSQSGKLTSLVKATPRELREGHNLEKMYISGEFKNYE